MPAGLRRVGDRVRMPQEALCQGGPSPFPRGALTAGGRRAHVVDVELSDAERPIGSAQMRRDGTLYLMLRAEGPGGLIGDAAFEIAPGGTGCGASYQAWLDRLGGMKPGDDKLVPPWPAQAS